MYFAGSLRVSEETYAEKSSKSVSSASRKSGGSAFVPMAA
jgi:hypothetical protein